MSEDTNTRDLIENKLREAVLNVPSLGSLESDELDIFLPDLYQELRMIARRTRRNNQPDGKFGTTSIVHETYLKLKRQSRIDWINRAQFIHIAAMAMRSILIDNVRRRSRQKRGGNSVHLSLDDNFLISDRRSEELLNLDAALEKLALSKKRWSDVIVCRVFGGMDLVEIANQLGISVATVKRDWQAGCLWLYQEMGRAEIVQPG